MTREEFKARLTAALANLPVEERDKTLAYYDEMLDDRIEDGMSEEEAVDQLEPVADIAARVVGETPIPVLVRESIERRRFSPLSIVLIVLGSPLWLTLGLTVFAVLLSVIIVLWSVALTLWAVFACFALCTPFVLLSVFVLPFLGGGGLYALCALAAFFLLGGLAILMFFAAKYCSIGIVRLTGAALRGIKSVFIGKEDK